MASIFELTSQYQQLMYFGDSSDPEDQQAFLDTLEGLDFEVGLKADDYAAVITMMDTLTDYATGMSGGAPVSTEQMVNYATGIAKVTTGAYDAMTKKGFAFTDAQKAVLKGEATQAQLLEAMADYDGWEKMTDDMRVAAIMSDVIGESWDGLYESMSNTPTGKIAALTNQFNSLQESIGQELSGYVMQLIDALSNGMDTASGAIDGVVYGLEQMLNIGISAVNAIANGAAWIYNNWNMIGPAIEGVITAVLAYKAATMVANYDGTELLVQYVASGTNLADPVTIGLINEPTRPDDDSGQYRYTYNGWNSALTNITAAKTITAQYTSTKFYFMTFNDYDGTLLIKTKILTGQPITDPIATGDIQTPTRAPETDYGYIFKAWSPTISGNATANKTYTATYKTDQHFTVWFMDYDGTTILDEQSVLDSEAALDPVTSGRISTPLREPTAQYEYTWTGWNKTFSSITEDTTVTATYSQTTRSYTVTWYDADTLQQMGTSTVLYNKTATYTGTKPGSSAGEYIVKGYSPSNTNIKADTDIYVDWYHVITDTWAQINAAGQDGTYSTKYNIGDVVAVDFGTEGSTYAMLVAKDADELADGSGNAKMTFINVDIFTTSHRWNPSRAADPDDSSKYQEGTGTIGGYDKSELKSYIMDTIVPLAPTDLVNVVKSVKKYSNIYDTSSSYVKDVVSTETFWAPSYREMNFGNYETLGPVYSSAFPDNASRIKHKVGATSAFSWWLRSAYTNNIAYSVSTSGANYSNGVNTNIGVVLGFCI